MFDRLLIANRGEIACRIIRTARRLGMETIAVHSAPDQNARHVRMVDRAFPLHGSDASETYLDIEKIMEIARETDVDAIHPGYGFLSENAKFAAAVEEADPVFVGPSSDVIEAMGEKHRAKTLMDDAGVPVVPDYRGEDQDPEVLREKANEIGFPVLLKPLAGGGGKGMRRVEGDDSFQDALDASKREAQSAFGDDRILIEKFLPSARHVEVQVFGDYQGNGIHLYERDCSLQRRYQKVVEEGPAPGLSESFRDDISDASVRAVDALEYTNAGTMEFIVDVSGDEDNPPFYFMEMNTRLQVEHPVTEMITGLDLVEWQLRIAAGEPLPRQQDEISTDGHAFEARLYAEDPSRNYQPQTGTVRRFVTPETGANVRVDTGIEEGTQVGALYDPLLAKVIVHASTRTRAMERMHRVLSETGVAGVTTNQEFLVNVFDCEAFRKIKLDTNFLSSHRNELIPDTYDRPVTDDLAVAAIYFLAGLHELDSLSTNAPADPWDRRDHWRMNSVRSTTIKLEPEEGEPPHEIQAVCDGRTYHLDVEGERITRTLVSFDGELLRLKKDASTVKSRVIPGETDRDVTVLRGGRSISLHHHLPGLEAEEMEGAERITASIPGTIIDVMVSEGDRVEAKEPILVMEAMKMEMTITADRSGIVDSLPVGPDDQVAEGDLLAHITDEGGS